MIILSGIHDGNKHIYQDTDLEGYIREGSLYIHNNVYCIVNGIVDYNVYIYEDALVLISGIVEENLYCYGGNIIIGGIVKGNINIYPHEL